MCGRFTRKENLLHLSELLGLKVLPQLKPRYNIAPSQLVACVRINQESQERECVELKWGLVPSWAKDLSIGNKMINARAESLFPLAWAFLGVSPSNKCRESEIARCLSQIPACSAGKFPVNVSGSCCLSCKS